jgi:signal peptidase II
MHKETKLPLKTILLSFFLIAIILIADQWIKVYIKSSFSPNEIRPLFGDWFVLQYIENQGMAFGATFSSSRWGKLSLSIFRVVAIIGIAYYLVSQARNGARKEFIIALSLILAGATGNLIDSMFYDFVFPYDPCYVFNHAHGSGNIENCDFFGQLEVKHKGFLFGNVVDMFRFQAMWPEWVPYFGGNDVFPAIWNLADGSITVGVVMVFLRQRTYFPKNVSATVAGNDITNDFSVDEPDDSSTDGELNV